MRLTRVTNVQPRFGGEIGCRLRVIDGPDAGAELSIPAVGAVVGTYRLLRRSVAQRHGALGTASWRGGV